MKVLFAVGSEQVSKNIADKYYEKYGEVLEYKNVFFFKALIDEIKRDKTYDRIVVSEEIEEYARTADLEQVDRRLFNYIDQITDETQDTDIIIICGNRRNKGDAFINKLFSIGIYNLLIGDDRNVTPLCDILKKPKTKREAKQYLGIDTSLISDSSMTRDDEVDEYQIRSILSYYDGIKNQPERYVETFDRIAEQYSRLQLIIIFNYLPPAVKKAIAETDRYRHLAAPPGEAARGPQGAGPAQPKQPQQPAAQAPQKTTITKPQKEKKGLFGNFKKNKNNPNKPTSEQAMESLAQTGSIDLSTNTPPAAPSSQAAEQAKLAQEKAEADKRAAEEAAKLREEAAKQQQQEELARKAREEQMQREQQAKAQAQQNQQAQVDSIQQAKEAEQRRLQELAKQQQMQREQAQAKQAEADEQKRLQELAKQQQLQRDQAQAKQAEADEQKRLQELAKQQQLQRDQAQAKQAEADEQKRLQELAKQQQMQRDQAQAKQAEADEQKRLQELAKQQQLQREQPTPSGINIKPNPNAPRAVPNKEFDIDVEPIAKTPTEPPKPVEPVKPVEPPKPAEPVRPVEPPKPAEPVKPIEPQGTVVTPVVPVTPISNATPSEPQQPKYAPPSQHVPTPEQLAGAKVVSPALSAEEARMKEQQENLAKEQQKIREAQEKLEEEKRKLKEEQEKLMTAQNQLRADGMLPNMPQYTTTVGANGRPQVPMGSFKKMVVFVGPNKAGTTFVVNAVAHAMANEKIMTSVLDMTRDKGMWYIYSQQYSTAMQKKMANYMQRISDGEELFIETSNPFLKIYSAPGSISDVRRGYKHKNIMDVVRNNANVVLVDADFTTPIDYFDHADEVYVVQDLDILKMPDTTLFLRELKNRGMNMKKIRVILNKYVKTATLNSKKLIQVMSTYSDPGMTYMESELLPSKVDFSTIPYNINNYTKYTEALCTGLNNYKGYSNDFLAVISEIVSKIYQNGAQSKMPQMGQPKGMKKFFG